MNAPIKPAYAHPLPNPAGPTRRERVKTVRKQAEKISRPAVNAIGNGECEAFACTWPTNFTKGLPHDAMGIVDETAFKRFVEAINGFDSGFDVPLGPETAAGGHKPATFTYAPGLVSGFLNPANPADKPRARGWESPVSGHVYDLEGPDAGSVGMAPAPRLGSDEFAAEMAELYAMALLRDVPFTAMATGAADQVISALNAMPWFDPAGAPTDAGGTPLGTFSVNRRQSRELGGTTALSRQTLFRGSTPGAKAGPYISQFMLQGNTDRRGTFGPEAGQISYGAQRTDQRVAAQKAGVDYMTDWSRWLDVQNGANLKGTDRFEPALRFVTTPRDLATYVHFDALYQGYLSACLLLLAHGAPKDPGLPEKNATGTRDAFATFGDPHILTLVTETATRSLKAVRRQKYNIHLRARPEALGGVACLSRNGHGAALGVAETPAADHVAKLEGAAANGFSIMDAIASLNGPTGGGGLPEIAVNYLLPMAFPEGSPMHPAYGAGHATVAGSCTTMLKAFFAMRNKNGLPLTLADIGMGVVVPTPDGQALVPAGGINGTDLTVEGELDKVAANVSVGRNMAGVHYYSDYYDSLRMGERVAVGMLMEQMLTYPEAMSLSLTSFDGEALVISHDGNPAGTPKLSVDGNQTNPAVNAWFTRHV